MPLTEMDEDRFSDSLQEGDGTKEEVLAEHRRMYALNCALRLFSEKDLDDDSAARITNAARLFEAFLKGDPANV